jgi:hypothetical protein
MLIHIFIAAIGVVMLMTWGLGILAHRRGGLFRIQYGSNFHKGYTHR